MKKICIITTLSSSIDNWIKPFLNEYHNNNIDVTIVCNMTKEYENSLKEEFPFVNTHAIPFPRGINLKGSIQSIFSLIKFFKKEKFDMVQYSTPNASFYAAIASKKAKIPVRLYCQWGMVFVTQKGLKRKIFERIERIICKNSTFIQPDSIGNLEFCRKNKFYDKSKSCLVWNGSAKGIDLKQYDISKKDKYANEIKLEYGIQGKNVIGFVGRLGAEKGCNELFKAFQTIHERYPNTKLLFVGPIEKENTIEPNLLKYFYECEDIIKTGRVKNVEKYISAMDIFILPSYREGFGMSVVEAQAMEVPVITTEYPGPSSAMKKGETGLEIPIRDVDAIINAVVYLIENKDAAVEFGKQGRIWVENTFEQTKFKVEYIKNRKSLLGLD